MKNNTENIYENFDPDEVLVDDYNKTKNEKMNILNSASKIVFILITLAVIFLTAIHIVDPKDFVVLASMAFAFYFSKPVTPDVSTTTSTTTNLPPAEK